MNEFQTVERFLFTAFNFIETGIIFQLDLLILLDIYFFKSRLTTQDYQLISKISSNPLNTLQDWDIPISTSDTFIIHN